MIKFKTAAAYAALRKAVAFIVQQNDDVAGTWHDIDVLKDLCNVVAGYDENSDDMRGVDVSMIQDAFVTKPPGGTCISSVDITGDDTDYFLHLKLDQNDRAAKIACSQSRDDSLINNVVEGIPIEKFDINDETELWKFSKHRLEQLLRQRKKEDDKKKDKQSGRDETNKLHEVSTTKTVRPGSTSGRTPQPKRRKEDKDDEEEDEDDTPMRALFQSASREQIIDEDNKIDDGVIDTILDALHVRFQNKERELTTIYAQMSLFV